MNGNKLNMPTISQIKEPKITTNQLIKRPNVKIGASGNK